MKRLLFDLFPPTSMFLRKGTRKALCLLGVLLSSLAALRLCILLGNI